MAITSDMTDPQFKGVDELRLTTVEILVYVLQSLSILALFVSSCLYGCCVQPKTQRYKMFIPMFLSSMLKHVVCLVDMIVWRYETDAQQTTIWRNEVVYKFMCTMEKFAEISLYSWISVLGVYYLFSVLGDIIKDRRILVLYLVGLGIPVVFATAWVLTVTFVLENHALEGGHLPHATHWITDAPKLACALISFCIFIVCIYASCRGLIYENIPELEFVKQGIFKCVLLLICNTAADLYLLVESYSNDGQSVSSAFSWNIYVRVVFRGLAGLLIATLLCFLDTEVYTCNKKPRKVNVVLVERGHDNDR